MNELGLFTGAGGGLLASKHLLGHRIVGYVENDAYCQRVIQARIRDGLLDDAPIWDDAKTFDGNPWRGSVDVISAGFPCQPFSVAGKRKGKDDERNLWPDTLRIIREVRPRFAFLENVPGLLAGHGYFGRILGDLVEAGYDAEWLVLSAADVGANHLRKRLWILAHSQRDGDRRQSTVVKLSGRTPSDPQVGLADQVRMWPTPRAAKTTSEDEETWRKRQAKGDVSTPPLALAVKMWPTPNTGDGDRGARKSDGRRGLLLTDCDLRSGPMWPTPRVTTGDYTYDGGDHTKPRLSLEGMAKMFPTPTAQEGQQNRSHGSDNVRLTLTGMARKGKWPTPGANDSKAGQDLQKKLRRREEKAKQGIHLHEDLTEAIGGGKLSPEWVEALMGWPPGWTSLESMDTVEFLAWAAGTRHGPEAWQDGSWEDGIARVVTQMDKRVDRLRALGNGQVPLVAATAWRILMARLRGDLT